MTLKNKILSVSSVSGATMSTAQSDLNYYSDHESHRYKRKSFSTVSDDVLHVSHAASCAELLLLGLHRNPPSQL